MQFVKTHQLNTAQVDASGKCVIYLTSVALRITQNEVLHNALILGKGLGVPVIVVYHAYTKLSTRNNVIVEFLYNHLKTLESDYKKLNIPFYVWPCIQTELLQRIHSLDPCAVFVDFCPLQAGQKRAKYLAQGLSIPVFETDAKNTIPTWISSPKEEFSAATFRPKVKRLLFSYLVPIPAVEPQPEHRFEHSEFDVSQVLGQIKCPKVTGYKLDVSPGEVAARDAIRSFLQNQYSNYPQKHNDPNASASSRLSAYLHFGIISPAQVALEVIKKERLLGRISDEYNGVFSTKSPPVKMFENQFLEELIVRRELAQNFCYHNPNYATPSSARSWAQTSLLEHASDKREFLYTINQFEVAQTHDPLWNAAQMQLTKTGFMAGYVRMYWAKKLLEWTPSPTVAQNVAIYLNDKYQLDGADANGYTGIAWSIFGVHDRAWFDRPIFGKIRYMNANGCRAKFDVQKYISSWL